MSTFKTRLDNLRHTEFLAVTQQEFGVSPTALAGSSWTGQLPAPPFPSVPLTSAKTPTVWRVPARLISVPALPVADAAAPLFPHEPEWNRPVSAPVQTDPPQATLFPEPEPVLPRPVEASVASAALPSTPVSSVPAPHAPLSVPPVSEVLLSSPAQHENPQPGSGSSDPLWAAPFTRAETVADPLDLAPATPSRMQNAEAEADAAWSPQELLTRAETVNPAPAPGVSPPAEAQTNPADAPARSSPRRATFREVMALNDLGSAEPATASVAQETPAPIAVTPTVLPPQTVAPTPAEVLPAQPLQEAAPLLAAALAPVPPAVADAVFPEIHTPSAAPTPSPTLGAAPQLSTDLAPAVLAPPAPAQEQPSRPLLPVKCRTPPLNRPTPLRLPRLPLLCRQQCPRL